MNGGWFTQGFLPASSVFNNWLIPALFLFLVLFGLYRKVPVYEVFVEGAKEGFTTAVTVIPYLVAILVAIAIFRASGALDLLNSGLAKIIPPKIFPPDTVNLALLKPLSGSGARGIMLDIFDKYNVDSFPGYVASVIQGSTETTFYVLAVYFGSVNIKRTRHAVPVGLAAEVIAIAVSVLCANLFWQGPK